MEMNFDFTAEEDFGLAKSFTNIPMGVIAPAIHGERETTEDDLKKEFQSVTENEIKADGFCFKMAPGQDVSLL